MHSPENTPPSSIHKSSMLDRPKRSPLYGSFPEPVDEMIERTSHGRGLLPRERQSFREFYEDVKNNTSDEQLIQPQPDVIPSTATAEVATEHPGVHAGDNVAEAFIGEERTSEEYKFNRGYSIRIALNGVRRWFTRRLPSAQPELEDPFADRKVYNTDDEVIDTVPSINVQYP